MMYYAEHRPITKKELAKLLGVSSETVRRYLDRILPQLKELGYRPSQRIIYGKPLNFVIEHFCIVDDQPKLLRMFE